MRDKFVQIFQSIPYISKPILKDIFFEINTGDRIGLIGNNGAGKTSLCRSLMGLYQFPSNQLSLYGTVRAVLSGGTVFYKELSGRENAELLISCYYPEEIGNTKFLDEIIEFSELGELMDTPFRTYSLGMKSRLLLSIALMKPADLLILDEAFNGVDIFFAEKAWKQAKIIIDASKASIIVSHSLEVINDICNKVIIMDKGEIVYQGDRVEGIKYYLAEKV